MTEVHRASTQQEWRAAINSTPEDGVIHINLDGIHVPRISLPSTVGLVLTGEGHIGTITDNTHVVSLSGNLRVDDVHGFTHIDRVDGPAHIGYVFMGAVVRNVDPKAHIGWVGGNAEVTYIDGSRYE